MKNSMTMFLMLAVMCGQMLSVYTDTDGTVKESGGDALTGAVVLDSMTFDKIISKFKASAVKFDIQYPYGEKHDEWVKVCQMAAKTGDLLMAEVGVNEHGNKEGLDLAKRYGVSKDDFPVIKLFLNGQTGSAVHFDDEFKSDAIQRFIRKLSGLRIPLDGCLQEFDDLANRFMDPSVTDRQRLGLLVETQKLMIDLTGDDVSKKSADTYIQLMTKVIAKGNEFIASESQRLEAIVSQKMTENKRKEIKRKINILLSFVTNDTKNIKNKSDL